MSMSNTNTVFWLNCHLFQGTILDIFYRKILYQDEQRYTAICQWIRRNNPTIIMLSEVWSKSMKRNFVRDLHDIYPYSWIPESTKWFKLGPEFVVLSKSPIAGQCYENFTNLSGWDWWSEKKICGCIIDNKFYCCTHLDTSDDCINSNILQVKHFIQQNSTNHSVILVGDFNESEFAVDGNPDSGLRPMYQTFCTTLGDVHLVDAQRAVYPDRSLHPLYSVDGYNDQFIVVNSPDNKVLRRLDYFFSRGITPTETTIVTGDYSDHYGVTLTYPSN